MHVMFILIKFISIFNHYDMSYFIELNNKGRISMVYCYKNKTVTEKNIS